MSISQISNAAVSGQKYHQKSLSGKISDMESVLSKGLLTGTVTSDQATAMKKTLDAIKTELTANQSSTGYISPDKSNKISKEIQGVGKQLAAALSSPSIASSNNISDILGGTQNNASSATNDYSAILKAIQTAQKSGDTQKVNSELKLFIAQTQMNTLYGLQGSAGSSATSAQSLISLIA